MRVRDVVNGQPAEFASDTGRQVVTVFDPPSGARPASRPMTYDSVTGFVWTVNPNNSVTAVVATTGTVIAESTCWLLPVREAIRALSRSMVSGACGYLVRTPMRFVLDGADGSLMQRIDTGYGSRRPLLFSRRSSNLRHTGSAWCDRPCEWSVTSF